MNFEFIKNLEGLNRAFVLCKNAEELAKSMPDQSMIASRKSAEVIAKFVYLEAHLKSVDDLNFADILSDYTVKNYLSNRSVLDAFHFVRKNGNKAAHTITLESTYKAITVLEKLHYVVGEVAKRMELIRNYPQFNTDIAENPNAVLYDIEDTGTLAQEMYDAYVISKDRANQFMEEFDELCSPFQFVPGIVDLNETLEFDHKPVLKSTISKIQEHFGFLALQALRYLRMEDPEQELKFSAEITLLGENGYTAFDLGGFMNGLMHDLPSADGFKISSSYYGPSVAPWFNNEVREEFSATVSELGEQESFTYTIFEFLYNHGESYCGRFENGKWINLEEQYSTDIIDKDFGKDWWCWNMDLVVEFDFEKYPDILEVLHETVRKYIPEDQLEYCENSWKDGDVGILISSISWEPRKLRVVQDFLDEINRILEPIKSEYDGSAMGSWYITDAPYAIATWDWTEDGFKVTGTAV